MINALYENILDFSKNNWFRRQKKKLRSVNALRHRIRGWRATKEKAGQKVTTDRCGKRRIRAAKTNRCV